MDTGEVIRLFYEKHIKDTIEKEPVTNCEVLICYFSNPIFKISSLSINLNTRVLKHLYDKKPAEEFDFIINNLQKIVSCPDIIYKNKIPKRGDYVFTKKILANDYFCSLELIDDSLFIVTVFRIRKSGYLKNYEFLWSWRGDIPSS